MIGFGGIINTVAIIAAGLAGGLFRRLFDEQKQEGLNNAVGVSLLMIGIAGALEGMLSISEGGSVVSGKSMFVVLSLAIGTAIGELINIERWFERFGAWLKIKSGNAKDGKFIDAFVTASLTVSIGAMAIVGSIQDGVSGDYSTLALKSVLDFIIIAVMCAGMGKGAAFSAVPVFVFEELMTMGARGLAPYMTDTAVHNISFLGSILIFCVGINLVWNRGIRVANMLPAIVVAAAMAYMPFAI